MFESSNRRDPARVAIVQEACKRGGRGTAAEVCERLCSKNAIMESTASRDEELRLSLELAQQSLQCEVIRRERAEDEVQSLTCELARAIAAASLLRQRLRASISCGGNRALQRHHRTARSLTTLR